MNFKPLAVLVIFLISIQSFSQNLDSLYNVFINHFQVPVKETNYPVRSAGDNKCGFGLVNEVQTNIHLFNPRQQAVLSAMLARPQKHTSIISPSGFFRLHYDTTGVNEPKYFSDSNLSSKELLNKSVDSLAAAFDYAYAFEVNFLGYDPPGPDNDLGGDNLYDVYITNYPDYGVTITDAGYNSNYITIENDFVGGFATSGIHAARATAAHEFHHSIQLYNYGYFGSDKAFHELTSTAMEEFVYDYVNDYYAYMNQYFTRTDVTFQEHSGYDLAAFYIFLQQHFAQQGNPMLGHEIIKRAWEITASSNNSLEAISQALFEYGSSFKSAWNLFGLWCYFTGSRSIPGSYFEEAVNYPLVQPYALYSSIPPSIMCSFEPVTNNFLFFEIDSDSITDTLVTVLTNADIASGHLFPYTSTTVTYTLTDQNLAGSKKIVNEYRSVIETDKPEYIQEGNIFFNQIVSGTDLVREVLDYAFPQPFIYSRHNVIYIPSEPNKLEYADLNIYTTAMDLVYSGKEEIIAGEKIVVKWNGLNNNGAKLPTGVYIYVTKSGDKVTKGKFVVYNE